MRFKRIDDPPDFLEGTLLNGILGIVTLLNEDRNYNGTDRLVLAEPDHSAHGLNDIDVTTSRVDKRNATGHNFSRRLDLTPELEARLAEENRFDTQLYAYWKEQIASRLAEIEAEPAATG